MDAASGHAVPSGERGLRVYPSAAAQVKKRKSTGHFIPCFVNFDRFVGGYLGGKYHLYSNGNNSSWIVTFRSSTIRDMHRRKEKET
mgnify:CR=1 FL=1